VVRLDDIVGGEEVFEHLGNTVRFVSSRTPKCVPFIALAHATGTQIGEDLLSQIQSPLSSRTFYETRFES
jgi:hypothetical protein